MELAEFIKWGMTVGAGILTFYLFEKIPALRRLTSEVKRITSYVMSSAFAIGFYWLGVLMQYEVLPRLESGAIDGRRLVEILFMVAAGATGLAQLIHGRAVLAQKIKIGHTSLPRCRCR